MATMSAIRRLQRLKAAATDGAVIGRLGGEEFAILLEGRTLGEGAAIAEQLRASMAALRFDEWPDDTHRQLRRERAQAG